MVRKKPTTSARPQNDQQEKAWRAVQEFAKMKPTLTSFARTMTGNPKVKVSGTHKGSSTDGFNDISVGIPMGLGDNTKHDRTYCNKRGDNFRQMCRACDIRELTLRNLYHEIGHIVGESMTVPTHEMRQLAFNLIKAFHPECEHYQPMMQAVRMSGNYVMIANALNEYMYLLWDGIEDARTDRRMIDARKGLKGIFRAGVRAGLDNGINHDDYPHQRVPFSYAGANSQALMYAYMRATGYVDAYEYIDHELLTRLDDDVLNRILSDAAESESAHFTFEIAIKAFVRLYELGFVQVERCEPKQDEADTPDIPSLNKEQDPNGSPDAENDGDTDRSPDQQDDGPSPASRSDDADDRADSGGAGDPGDDGSGDGSDAAGGSAAADPDPAPEGNGDEEQAESSGGGGDSVEDRPEDPQRDQGAVPDEGDGDSPDGGGESGGDQPGDLDHREPGDPEVGGEPGAADTPGKSGNKPGPLDGGDLEWSQSDEESGSGGTDAAPDGDGDRDGEPATDGAQDASTHGDAGDPATGDGEGAAEDQEQVDSADGKREDGGETAGREPSASPEGDDRADAAEPVGADIWDGAEAIAPPQAPIDDDDSASSAGRIFRELTGHSNASEPDAMEEELEYALAVDDDGHSHGAAPEEVAEVIEKAVNQVGVFDTSSRSIGGLFIQTYPNYVFRWQRGASTPEQFMPTSSIIGEALMDARLTFSANKRDRHERNLRSGKINGAALARRAPFGDDRMFHKKVVPNKRSYAVVIGIDVSGSTRHGGALERIKRAVFAQTEILSRLGIEFAVFAHTGGPDITKPYKGAYDYSKEFVWELQVKDFNEPWNDMTKERLANLVSLYNNFDGHSLEFYRKAVEKRSATDKIILYYTDGAMPAANYTEELEILQREIAHCQRHGIALMAVGINTDSPNEFGFDTVQVDSDEDLKKVVRQLKNKLTKMG
jgi:hypothetical protein